RRMTHIERPDTGRTLRPVRRIEREQKRRIEVAAFVSGRVDVTMHLVAAAIADVSDERRVARQAVRRVPALDVLGADASLFVALGMGAGTARRRGGRAGFDG